jgi:hypothetical protein
LEEVDHWGHALERFILFLAPSLYFPAAIGLALCSVTPFHYDVLPHHRSRNTKPVDHGLKPPKLGHL